MKKSAIWFCCLATLVASTFSPAASSQSSSIIAIINANVIDGIGNQPILNATVMIKDGKISGIAANSRSVPAGASVIDLKGYWLLPGFVDAHTHIADMRSARAALVSGVTTARNLGIPYFVDKGIGELNRRGVTDVPELLCAGYHVRVRPVEEFFISFPQLQDLMGGVRGETAVRRVVRAQIDRGVDVIKINATERAGLPDTDPRQRTFTDEEIAAIVDEARKSSIYVASHAHGDEGAFASVQAGVRSIEHGTYLSDKTLALMKERGTFFVPTISTMAEMIEPRNDVILQIRGKHMAPRVRETTAKAIKMGVKILAGTDTEYDRTSNFRLANEIQELINCGMAPMEAIKAATSYSAECAGIQNRTGAIKIGLEADLIAIERDPLTDVRSLQDVLLVINNGKVALNRLKW